MYIIILSAIVTAISAVLCVVIYGIRTAISKQKNTSKPRPDYCIGVPVIVFAFTVVVTMLVSAIAGTHAERTVVSETKHEISIDENGTPYILNYTKYNPAPFGIIPVNPVEISVDVMDNKTRTIKTLEISDRENIIFDEAEAAYYIVQDIEYENIWMERFALEQPDDNIILHLPESALPLIQD